MKINTISDIVYTAIPQHNKAACLMVKRNGAYQPVSAGEVVNTAELLAAFLLDLGVRKGDRVGIFSETRAEWAYADLAILCCGGTTVPIYSTLPAKQAAYIINDSEMEILFVSSEIQLAKIIQVRSEIPRLKHVILFDAQEVKTPEVISLPTAIEKGRARLKSDPEMVRKRAAENGPEDVFTIVYTSGTTGEPKGVMLTHKNLISNIEATITLFRFNPDDIILSFLPLSHILERMAGYYSMLYAGCTIAYAEGIESLAKNMSEVSPTLFISVPRVYEKFHQRIMDNAAAETGFRKKLVGWALNVANEHAEARLAGKDTSAGLTFQHALADILVYRKIRRRLGGRLRLLVSGGAALPRHLGVFFYGIGLTILEGYGLTETSPVIAANRPESPKFGTVGPPISGVEVKIAEDGEILTRGPHVMKGYYRKPQETAEVFTQDGWFKTGDIGELDSQGFLRITDRKKDLLVTSGGKNIAPQYVENTLKNSKYVAQIIVVGDKRKFASALIVPNMDHLKEFAAANQIPASEILKDPAVLNEVMADIDRLSQDLAPFERVKKIVLLEKEFTIESGELTPSLKVRRPVVEKKYRELIDNLYSEQLRE